MLRREMKIHCLTVAKNEADRYWRSFLEAALTFSDDVLYLDDASDDATPDIAAEYEDVIEIEPSFERRGLFGDEAPYRKALFEFGWDVAEPGDILCWLDADMMFLKDPTEFFEQEEFERYAFYLYDLWATDEQHMIGQYGRKRFAYRDEPPYWRAHEAPRTWAIRATDESVDDFEWEHKRGIHAGHLPGGYLMEDRSTCIVPKSHGIAHYGYLDPVDQERKHELYMSVEDQLQGAERDHAESIVDESPRLRPLPFDVDEDLVLEKP